MIYPCYKPFFLAVEKLREQACTREIYSLLGLSDGRAGSIGPLIMIRSGLSNLTLKAALSKPEAHWAWRLWVDRNDRHFRKVCKYLDII